MAKKRIFVIGSCVSRDLFELTDRYDIAAYTARSSLASAFAEKSFFGPSDTLLENSIDSRFLRRCVKSDTYKMLPKLLRETEYDALLLDFVEERFKLLEYQNAFATLSGEFARTDLHKTGGIKTMRPLNRKRKKLWIKAVNDLVNIAIEKNIPVFLNEVYPAYQADNGQRHPWFRVCRRRFYLDWFYKHTPAYVQRFHVPKKLFIAGSQHRLGGQNSFHYIPAVYECLLQQLDNAL